jgi:hypothetical protein
MRTEEARLDRAQVGAAPSSGGVEGAGRTLHEVVQTLTAYVDESPRIADRSSRAFQA